MPRTGTGYKNIAVKAQYFEQVKKYYGKLKKKGGVA